MSDINFVKQSGKNNVATKPKHYAVEYTTPNQSKRSLRGWLDWFKGKHKHVVPAATQPVPVKLTRPLTTLTVPNSNQIQAQAKPEIKPIQVVNNNTANVMPVKSNDTAEKVATKLAPTLQPLTKANINQSTAPIQVISVPQESSQLNNQAVTVKTQPTTVSATFFSEKKAVSSANKNEKTVLMKVKPIPHSVAKQTVTALRVIPTPPAPPVTLKSVALTAIVPKVAMPQEKHIQTPVVQSNTASAVTAQTVAARVLPTAPRAPLKGVPASNKPVAVVAQNIKSKNPISKPVTTQKDQLNVVQAKNVAEFVGQTTNPNKTPVGLLHINLLPHFHVSLTPLVHKIQQLINTVLLVVVCVAVFYLLLLGYQTYYVLRTNVNLEQVTTLENNIVSYQSLQQNINQLTTQINVVNNVLTQHHYWTNVFTILEQYTLPNVYYTLVNADEKGVVTLQAVTSDYTSISHQLEVFKQAKDYIQLAQVVTATSGSSETETNNTTNEPVPSTPAVNNGLISFNISLQLNPEILTFYNNGYFKK